MMRTFAAALATKTQRAEIGTSIMQLPLFHPLHVAEQIAVIDNLSQGPPKPLYELDTKVASGEKPGAGPAMVLSPYGAAVKFVLAGDDLEKNVKQTAAEIATRMEKKFRESK